MRGPVILLLFVFLLGCSEVLPAAVNSAVTHDTKELPAQLARDVRRLCYRPYSIHGPWAQEICKYYVFASSFVDMWNVSREYCRSLSDVFGVPMDLTAIESREENDVIKQTIQSDFPGVWFWTSGTDRPGTYITYWIATGRAVDYFDWVDAGQPSGYRIDNEISIALGYLGWATSYTAPTTHVKPPLCEQNTVF